MMFIRSFKCSLPETDNLAAWLNEVAIAIEVIPYHKLRLIAHEAFVNCCKFSEESSGHIIVMVRRNPNVEIIVTDPGKGFYLPEDQNPFDTTAIGTSWLLVSHKDTSVSAEVDAPYRLRFHLNTGFMQTSEDLKENHRGLISILKSSKELYYHYVPNSFNYLRITC